METSLCLKGWTVQQIGTSRSASQYRTQCRHCQCCFWRWITRWTRCVITHDSSVQLTLYFCLASNISKISFRLFISPRRLPFLYHSARGKVLFLPFFLRNINGGDYAFVINFAVPLRRRSYFVYAWDRCDFARCFILWTWQKQPHQ